jgi:hypothetical protein
MPTDQRKGRTIFCKYRLEIANLCGADYSAINNHKQPMQIAGSACRACGKPMVLAAEGKFCAGCNSYTHVSCEPEPQCHRCGQKFQRHIPTQPNPLRDAILPRALRSENSSAAVFFLIASLAFLIILAYALWKYGFAHMHDSM